MQNHVTIAVIAIFTLFNIYWLPTSGVTIGSQSYLELAKVMAAVTAGGLAGAIIKYRLRLDPSRPGRLIANYADGTSTLCLQLGLFALFSITMTIFTYLASATGRPLVDAQLAAIDLRFGFDWLAALQTANASPMLARLLVLAYHSLGVQLAVVFLLLPFAGRGDRLAEFLAVMAVAGLISAMIMASFPSAGAYVYFQPASELHSSFTGNSGLWHYSHLMQLRSGAPFEINQVEGLVTFPSFHTALAILIPYALRNVRWLFAPAVALNALMIAGTIPEGGHYLIDVIAGAAIAVAAVFAVRAVQITPALGTRRSPHAADPVEAESC